MAGMLPVEQIEGEIAAALRASNRLVLRAPTGSGKSTQVPTIALRAGLGSGRIIVTQPRRLATRLVAQRVAEQMGERLGQTVGFATRHERAVSEASRIVFMTEGLLLRQLQGDRPLAGVDAVILDEFHERSLQADMALGLLRMMQQRKRADLRVVVMSATLDVQRVARWLDATVLEAEGRAYDVAINYLGTPTQKPCWELAAAALRDVPDDGGDVLVFMPGVYEIGRTIEAARKIVRRGTEVLPLHGSLTPAEQDRAVTASKRRTSGGTSGGASVGGSGGKVIVATNVAETSITIDGVTHVIDSGLARQHQYDAARDINVLRVLPISQASADQRAGRAGRTAPGSCQRLWTAAEHGRRETHSKPEVQRVELSAALLQLADMDAADLPWLDAPPQEAIARAEALLRTLGAFDEAGAITDAGRQMARFGDHPRIARLLLEASQRRCLTRAIHWAAILSERDGRKPLPRGDEGQSDLEVIEQQEQPTREMRNVMHQLQRTCRHARLTFEGKGRTDDLIQCVLAAFGDHVAVLRDAKQRYCHMPPRKRVMLDAGSCVTREGPIVAMQVTEIGRGDSSQTNLSLASAIDPAWLDPRMLAKRERLQWNNELGLVEQITERCLGELVIDSTSKHVEDAAAAGPVLVEQIMSGVIKLSKWDDTVEQWIERVRCVSAWYPERNLIAYDDDDRQVILLEIVHGATKATHVRDRECLSYVKHAMDWDEQQFVQRMAPSRIELPGAQRRNRRESAMRVVYQAGSPPRGRAKIQDLYDLTDTPRVGGGRVKVLLEILGPNFRPVQVTDDLAGFWERLYPEVRKELKRRYPKHDWR